jgi:hypothetical protein
MIRLESSVGNSYVFAEAQIAWFWRIHILKL